MVWKETMILPIIVSFTIFLAAIGFIWLLESKKRDEVSDRQKKKQDERIRKLEEEVERLKNEDINKKLRKVELAKSPPNFFGEYYLRRKLGFMAS